MSTILNFRALGQRIAAALAGVLLAGALPRASAAVAAALPVNPITGYVTVSGIVTALTDESMTLNDHEVVDLTLTTTCSEDGRPIMVSDLEVGERVTVACFRDPQTDRQTAELIDVHR